VFSRHVDNIIDNDYCIELAESIRKKDTTEKLRSVELVESFNFLLVDLLLIL